ncbi:MAG: 4-hydroxy-3-methylbut-2-enyl diphosphate reductase, partial [Rhodospirillales bacterium]|nr:4-hydroxy-3-methylbut-2-enyl diphosphate reductase [Rhodospirillales bacterium]
RRGMLYLDATCPLVSKVHREAERQHRLGNQIVMIGHQGHPEVIGTMGQLPKGSIILVETVEDVEKLEVADPGKLGFITQTTLSVDDTASIVEALTARFPQILGPRKEDICYATTNRQEAVKAIAGRSDAMIVVGAPNSSNSRRLVEVAEKQGCRKAVMVQRAQDLDLSLLEDVASVGLTAGASAPEVLVEELIALLRQHYTVTIEEVVVRNESVVFKLPRQLTGNAA